MNHCQTCPQAHDLEQQNYSSVASQGEIKSQGAEEFHTIHESMVLNTFVKEPELGLFIT